MTQPGRCASPAGTTPQPTLFPTTPLLCHDVPALTSSLTSPERNSRRPSSARTPQFRVIVTPPRSEEHTSELQSLMRISYAVFCLKKQRNLSYNAINITLNRTSDNQLLTLIRS